MTQRTAIPPTAGPADQATGQRTTFGAGSARVFLAHRLEQARLARRRRREERRSQRLREQQARRVERVEFWLD